MRTLYVCYFDHRQPLVRTQVVAYLAELSRSVDVTLLTFDVGPTGPEDNESSRAWCRTLVDHGIEWHSLPYHKWPTLPATLYDIAAGARLVSHLVRRKSIDVIHARSHVPGLIGWLVKKRTGCRLIFDIRGLMAEEYVDAGRWRPGGALFRLTKAAERRILAEADGCVVLTRRARDLLFPGEGGIDDRGRPIEVIPCCVDVVRYIVPPEKAAAYRRDRGWDDRIVLAYVGSVGTWYKWDEMARFAAVARQVIPNLYFQVFTQRDVDRVRHQLREDGWSGVDCDVRSLPPQSLPEALAACDAGLSFIVPCFSKLASSPTKVGEYLAAGLPVVANAGIGDCDELFDAAGLRTVVRAFTDEEYRRVAEALAAAMGEPSARDRCREAARQELSLTDVGGPRYRRLYERVLSVTERTPPESEGQRPTPFLNLKVDLLAPRSVCPACGEADLVRFAEKNRHVLRRCRRCGTISTTTQDREVEVGEMYDDRYRKASFAIPLAVRTALSQTVVRFAPYRQSGRLLDIGFGEGALLTVAGEQGWSCHGVELAQASLDFGTARGWTVARNAEDPERFPPAGFDVVTAFELVEHVPNPRQIFDLAHRCLRPGGLLYLTTPNADSLNSKYLDTRWSIFAPPEHLVIWSPQGIRRALGAAGFQVRCVRTEGFNPVEIMAGLRGRGSSPPTNEAHTRNQSAASLNRALTSSPFRRSVKRLLNEGLNLLGIGDTLKVYARRRCPRRGLSSDPEQG